MPTPHDPATGAGGHDPLVHSDADASRIPLLEYDADPTDFVGDGWRGREAVILPRRGVITFLGEATRHWVEEQGFTAATVVDTVTRDYPIWVGDHQGVEVAVADAPICAPAATIVLERMFMLGVDTIVATGSCGALVPHEVGTFLVPTRALRDEGTSFHYLPASRWIETDPEVRAACEAAITGRGLKYTECATWTTDGFLRETRAKVEARRAEGCETVEMECAAFAAVAQFRGARFGQILYSADTLAGEQHDVRGWGHTFRDTALSLALDAVARA